MDLVLVCAIILAVAGVVWLVCTSGARGRRAARSTLADAASITAYGADPHRLMVGDSIRVGKRDEDVCRIVAAVDVFDGGLHFVPFLCQFFLLETAEGTTYWLSVESTAAGTEMILWDGFVCDEVPEHDHGAYAATFLHNGITYDAVVQRPAQYRVTQGADSSERFALEAGSLQYVVLQNGEEWLLFERFNWEGSLQVRRGTTVTPGDIYIIPVMSV